MQKDFHFAKKHSIIISNIYNTIPEFIEVAQTTPIGTENVVDGENSF